MQVTSVEVDQSGASMLVGSKDNSNRLWDMRMVCGVLTASRLP